MIHECAALMNCPIILTTNYYRVVTMDDCGFDVDDPVWRRAKENGYCDADPVALFESEGVTKQVLSNRGAILLQKGLASRIPRILQKVMVFGKPGGFLGIFQMGEKFGEEDLVTADYLCQVLSVMLERDPEGMTYRRSAKESIMADLLTGTIKDPTGLNDRLRAAFWEPDPVFRVLMAEYAEEAGGAIDGGAERILYAKDLVFEVLPRKIGQESFRAFSQTAYKNLNRYDREHGTDYCVTVLTYIECACNSSAAADRLYIHRNTMLKRLSRISDLSGMDLSDGRELIYFYLTAMMAEHKNVKAI